MREGIPPTHDILPVPGGLDVVTLEFVMEQVSLLALEFELDPLTHQVDPTNPSSINEFIEHLEEQIKRSSRESAEKDGALMMLSKLMEILKRALEQSYGS